MINRLKPIGIRHVPLGTDELGRDMLSRLIWGARLSLLMGVTPVVIAFVDRLGPGHPGGYAGGWSTR
jgi:peptide/nickel transport system permease protein